MKTKVRITVVFIALGIAVIAYGFGRIKPEKIVPENSFVLVELYTSEGCSSCPPADALVAKIMKENKDKPVYILGYHVDYWNRLGWKDVYSKPEFSKRQRQYAGWLHSNQVYTPQIVINGTTAFVGSDEKALRNAIRSNLSNPKNYGLTLSATSLNAKEINLKYQLKTASLNSTLYVATLRMKARSDIKNGENSGRVLNHVNIVENLQIIPVNHANGFAKVVLNKDDISENTSLIGFLQDNHTGKVMAASKIIVRKIE